MGRVVSTESNIQRERCHQRGLWCTRRDVRVHWLATSIWRSGEEGRCELGEREGKGKKDKGATWAQRERNFKRVI